MPVDNAKARTSQRGRHVHPAGVKGVGHWVILPYLSEGWIYVTSAITAYQVDLPIEITGCHKGTDIRHWRSSTPCIGCDVVDARGIDHRTSGRDRKSTRLNSSHLVISYAVFCLKKKKI